MGSSVVTASFALLCVFLLCEPSLQTAEQHSLYYIYTALSQPVDKLGIYQFTAMGLLDDREIDYYNSKDKIKIPRQIWMREKMDSDYWDKGTQSRKSKEQGFNVNVDILMKRMRHNESDVHVLQWRHGCEIKQDGDQMKFSKGIDEYSYDGDDFLSFDDKESQWIAPVDAALPTKRKWDNEPTLNQYTKGYLEKECVDWLNRFREYGDAELKNGSPPKVHVFAKRCTTDKTKVKLACFATGFYPKDVIMTIRKYRSALPDNEIESSGIRPNHDGTFQLKKTVIIPEDEKADYECFVSHKTLKEPIVIPWNGKCQDCTQETIVVMVIGVVIGGLVLLAIGALVYFLYFKRRKNIAGQERANNKSQERGINFAPLNKLPKTVIGGSDSDSGKGSAGSSSDNSPSNSQESMNLVSETSSGQSQPAEGQTLLQQSSE